MAKKPSKVPGTPGRGSLSPTARLLAQTSSRPPSDTTAKSLGVAGSSKVSAISFGAFRAKTSTTSSQGSQWSSLLKNAASGGVASAFGGGSFSGILGLGGLVSSIINLFGSGKSAPPAPVQFTLAQSQQSSLTLHEQPFPIASQPSVGNSPDRSLPVANPQNSASINHSQVVQVVRQALLNSSSLNDVIAEI